MTLRKADIIENIRARNDLLKKQAAEIVDTLLQIIKDTLGSGEDVMITGFGKFSVNEKRERRGRNPASGKELMLEPRRIVTFKCSGKLREKVNGR